jgi:hypothetical protein
MRFGPRHPAFFHPEGDGLGVDRQEVGHMAFDRAVDQLVIFLRGGRRRRPGRLHFHHLGLQPAAQDNEEAAQEQPGSHGCWYETARDA